MTSSATTADPINLRDLDATPYDAQELRVCEYLRRVVPEIGCGVDPVGFLIASHAALREDIARLSTQCAEVSRIALSNGEELMIYQHALEEIVQPAMSTGDPSNLLAQCREIAKQALQPRR